MNNNEIIIYCVLGHDGFIQYQQYNEMVRAAQEARFERERQECRKRLKYIGSVLWQSIEPTAEYYHKWHNVDNMRHPSIEMGIATVEYAVNVGEIAYDEYVKIFA